MIESNQTDIPIVLDNKQRSYATGKRKNSIARVWLKKGEGKITINGKSVSEYFSRPVLRMIINQPLEVIKGEDGYDIKATVKGGGLSKLGAVEGLDKSVKLTDEEFKLIEKGPITRFEVTDFNLGSHAQIGEYLMDFGWEPKEFTPTG